MDLFLDFSKAESSRSINKLLENPNIHKKLENKLTIIQTLKSGNINYESKKDNNFFFQDDNVLPKINEQLKYNIYINKIIQNK